MSENAQQVPAPSGGPTPAPSGDNAVTSVIEGVGSALTWADAHRGIVAIVVIVVGAFVLHGKARAALADRGRSLEPLQMSLSKAFKLVVREDTVRWRQVYLLLALTCVAVRVAPVPGNIAFWVTAISVVVVAARCRQVAQARKGLLMQIYDMAAGECKYGRGSELAPWNWVRVMQWADVTTPGPIAVSFPPRYRSEEKRTRESFEAQFNGSVTDANAWTFQWESSKNRIVCTPVPHLPNHAPYSSSVDDGRKWNEFPLGLTYGEKAVVWDCLLATHMLISGPTGVGKSVAQRTLLLHALIHADAWRIVLLDPKKVELGAYKHHSNVSRVATELDDMTFVLRDLEAEMMERYAQMEQEGVSDFMLLQQPPPAIMCMIDELTSLVATEGGRDDAAKDRDALRGKATGHLGQLLRLGRASGIHFVLATQRPDAKYLPGEFKNNVDARMACGRMDTTPSMMVLDSEDATSLPPIKGRSIYRSGPNTYTYQAWFCGPEHVDRIVGEVADKRQQVELTGAASEEPPAQSPFGDSPAQSPNGDSPTHAGGKPTGGLRGTWARRAAGARNRSAELETMQEQTTIKRGNRRSAEAGATTGDVPSTLPAALTDPAHPPAAPERHEADLADVSRPAPAPSSEPDLTESLSGDGLSVFDLDSADVPEDILVNPFGPTPGVPVQAPAGSNPFAGPPPAAPVPSPTAPTAPADVPADRRRATLPAGPPPATQLTAAPPDAGSLFAAAQAAATGRAAPSRADGDDESLEQIQRGDMDFG